jgi:nicotinamidase-related amidase
MELIGSTALILVDVQRSAELQLDNGIPHMPGGPERVQRARRILAAARTAGIPPIFIQEVHKRTLVDFGRELDGSETVHCLEGDELTELASGLEPGPDDYHIRKRRYSAFFATELDLVLRSYGIETVVLLGGLTDVCVHYTFADAHQHDYRCRVVVDATGGSSIEAHEASLRAMSYLQRDCLTTTDEVLAAFAAPAPAGVPA